MENEEKRLKEMVNFATDDFILKKRILNLDAPDEKKIQILENVLRNDNT